MKVFGKDLSRKEFESVKAIFEKEFKEKASVAELNLAIDMRKKLLSQLAKRKITDEEALMIARSLVAEEKAEWLRDLAKIQ